MWVFVAVMIVTALWFVLGAVLHGGREVARDTAGDAWWWESSDRSTGLVGHHALPSSHPLARLTHSSARSNG
jgi:hypothetical protein